MKSFKIFLVFVFIGFNHVKSQELSYLSFQGGYNWYKISAIPSRTEGTTIFNTGFKIGLNSNWILIKDALRFEYNAFYLQEKYCIKYITNIHGIGNATPLVNHNIQNQFLLILTEPKNIFNFRTGLAWDVLLSRQSQVPSGIFDPSTDCIYSGEDDNFSNQQLSILLGFSFIVKRRVSLSFDFIWGVTTWYTAGKVDGKGYFDDLSYQKTKRRMWSFTVGYIFYKKNFPSIF